jgi:ribonuclease E
VPVSKLPLQPAAAEPAEPAQAQPEEAQAAQPAAEQQAEPMPEPAAVTEPAPKAPAAAPKAGKAWGALAVLEAGFVVALAAAGIALWHQGSHWIAAAGEVAASQEGAEAAAAAAAEREEQLALEAAAAAGLAAIPEDEQLQEEEEAEEEEQQQRAAAGTPVGRVAAALADAASRILSPVMKPPRSAAALSAEGESEEPTAGEEGPAPSAARWGGPPRCLPCSRAPASRCAGRCTGRRRR